MKGSLPYLSGDSAINQGQVYSFNMAALPSGYPHLRNREYQPGMGTAVSRAAAGELADRGRHTVYGVIRLMEWMFSG